MSKLHFLLCLILGVSFIQASDDSGDYLASGEGSNWDHDTIPSELEIESGASCVMDGDQNPTMGSGSGKKEGKVLGGIVVGESEDGDSDNIVFARLKKRSIQ